MQVQAVAIRIEQETQERAAAEAREMRGYRVMAHLAQLDFDKAFADLAPNHAPQEVRVVSETELAESLDGTTMRGEAVATRYEAADVPISEADFMSLFAGLTSGPQRVNGAAALAMAGDVGDDEWGTGV